MSFFSKLFNSRNHSNDPAAINFHHRLDAWKADLPITNFRGFALMAEDGALHLTTGIIDLLPKANSERNIISQTEFSFGFNLSLPTEEAIPIIQECSRHGILRLPGERLINLFTGYTKYRTSFNDHWSGFHDEFPRSLFFSISLDGSPDEDKPGPAVMNYALRCSDRPFNDLDDLYDKLRLPKAPSSSNLIVRAHSPISIVQTKSNLDHGSLHIILNAPLEMDISKISVGYASSDSPSDRGRLQFIERDKEHLVFATNELTNSKYKVYANYDEANVDEGVVIDAERHSSPMAGLLNLFDPSLLTTRRYIDGKGKFPANDFEAGISILFSLLGFSVMPLHVASMLTEASDAIIMTPEMHFGVIECTLLDLNNKDKLSKLRRRTEQIRAYLKERGLDSTVVLPIVVSPLPRSEICADLPMAKENNVCVLAKEDLDKLLDRASLLPAPEQVFGELVSQIN